MIPGIADNIPGEHLAVYRGRSGLLFRRTLLDAVPASIFRYVRDIIIPAGSVLGEHPHIDDEGG